MTPHRAARPRLLDLFCGAGGAAMGYHRAGFEVVGVDIKPQPNYPFEFHQADVMTMTTAELGAFDAIHASPPCQAYSKLNTGRWSREHPRLISPTREALQATGLPYVIENVEYALRELDHPIRLCGSAFGLDVRRHRLFECSGFHAMSTPCAHHWQLPRFRSLDLHQKTLARVVGVHGHLNYPGEFELRKRAMGIEWMKRNEELVKAIPPAYTEWIGRYLVEQLAVAA